MITSMHCRPLCASDFNFARPLPPAYFYHDQLPSSSTPRRRRRLEDPILTHASNYYVTYPTPPSSPLSLAVPRPVYQPLECSGLYCDLFNLLEQPETAPTLGKAKQRRHARPADAADNAHGRMKTLNDRKRAHHHHHLHPSLYHKEKKRSEEKISGKDTDRSRQQMHRHSPPRGFFRRIVRTYFCMPPALTNNGYSS